MGDRGGGGGERDFPASITNLITSLPRILVVTGTILAEVCGLFRLKSNTTHVFHPRGSRVLWSLRCAGLPTSESVER